jgi:hypothetical protein
MALGKVMVTVLHSLPLETSQTGTQGSTFPSASLSFKYSLEFSINLCFEHSPAFLVKDFKLFHILSTKQLQRPKSHVVKFVSFWHQYSFFLVSLLLLMSNILLIVTWLRKNLLDSNFQVQAHHGTYVTAARA